MFLVDSNEPAEIVAQFFPEARRIRLPVGDIVHVESGVYVERKRPMDLLASIADGRLYDQCSRLSEKAKLPVLLIHGSFLPDRNGKVVADGIRTAWDYWKVQAALVSVQTGGVVVLQVPRRCLRDAVDMLVRWSTKKEHRVVRTVIGGWLRPDPDVQVMTVLTGNMKRANALLDHFGSVANAIDHFDEWPDVKHIGPKTIERARGILFDDQDRRREN